MKKLIPFILLIIFVLDASSQSWERKGEVTKPPMKLFKSTYAVTLPTAETLAEGDFLYGISHRFLAPVNSGFEDFFGLDGGANMRMNLGYALTDDIFLNLGRGYLKNFNNAQYDFEVKYKLFKHRDDNFPLMGTILGGVAYNTYKADFVRQNDISDIPGSRLFQFYGIAILNTMIAKKLGIGISPAFLYNAAPFCECNENTVTFGSYIQYYIDDMWAVILEANPTVTGWRQYYDSYGVGLELKTGGHFFKFIFSNNQKMNMSHYLSGAEFPYDADHIYFGFQITRNL